MSQNKNGAHSSKIWLQCIRVLLSLFFFLYCASFHGPTHKYLQKAPTSSLKTCDSLIYHFTILSLCPYNDTQQRPTLIGQGMELTVIIKTKQKNANKKRQTKKTPQNTESSRKKTKKKNKNNTTHHTLKHILSSIHIANYLTIQIQIILEEERSSDQSHRSLQQNQDQKPHII